MNIEAKLGLDVFQIDSEQSHILIDQEVCQSRCTIRYCLHVCPADLYDLNENGEMTVDYEGCLECGTCYVACREDALEWHYPRAGYGVQYRFG
ncbi:MAG: 4Fe-4S dicluster domain-containing protein [Anaerolineales bacterium]|nr:4Fe-4S dicluster domain-containing protein [Anaerolineales bacterium]MBS3753498.1 4Fe-4S dicluster domain-containing protein [Anaerolineales bacterium]